MAKISSAPGHLDDRMGGGVRGSIAHRASEVVPERLCLQFGTKLLDDLLDIDDTGRPGEVMTGGRNLNNMQDMSKEGSALRRRQLHATMVAADYTGESKTKMTTRQRAAGTPEALLVMGRVGLASKNKDPDGAAVVEETNAAGGALALQVARKAKHERHLIRGAHNHVGFASPEILEIPQHQEGEESVAGGGRRESQQGVGATPKTLRRNSLSCTDLGVLDSEKNPDSASGGRLQRIRPPKGGLWGLSKLPTVRPELCRAFFRLHGKPGSLEDQLLQRVEQTMGAPKRTGTEKGSGSPFFPAKGKSPNRMTKQQRLLEETHERHAKTVNETFTGIQKVERRHPKLLKQVGGERAIKASVAPSVGLLREKLAEQAGEKFGILPEGTHKEGLPLEDPAGTGHRAAMATD